MRVDLHNHTIDYSDATKNIYKTDIEAIYTTKILFNDLDYLAITNYHDVKNAMMLQEKFEDYIIVGAEYLVVEKTFPLHIVCFPLDDKKHKLLMSARLRGIKYFTNTLIDQNIVFFLTRIGWGTTINHEIAKNLSGYLKYFYAIDVANISIEQEMIFAKKISQYYHLSMIGGSDTLVSQKNIKVYTESTAENLPDFFKDIQNRKTTIGQLSSPQKQQNPSFWQKGKDFYRRHLYQIELNHLNLEPQRLQKSLHSFLPSLEFISQTHHLYKLEKHSQQINKLERIFVDYLKAKSTEDIFQQNIPPTQKKSLWLEAMHKINQCFE